MEAVAQPALARAPSAARRCDRPAREATYQGGGRLVYVVGERLARRRVVEIGVVSVTEVEILSGLEAGETIVLSDVGRFDGVETVLLTN